VPKQSWLYLQTMAKSNNKDNKSFRSRLVAKYRFVVLNENTFEEMLSYKLSRLNVFMILSISAILLIAATYLIISVTPLKEYIPGYDSTALRRQAINNTYRIDSLQQQLFLNERYITSIADALSGSVDLEDIPSSGSIDDIDQLEELDFSTNKQDSILRAEVAQEDRFNLFETAGTESNFTLFTPVNGVITQGYSPSENHLAVDISVPEKTPVKAVSDGTVILAEWTTETGYVVIIKHQQNLISVYKHNESLAVNQGDLVLSGEVISFAGSTGILSTGPHLHLELWSDGYPINPTELIEFE
jgi:murein DD-endopeptidase MepM/ murein hydrolase activator NlpD